MRILLTGSEGFIGRHLRGAFETRGWTVYGLDKKADPPRDVTRASDVSDLLASGAVDAVCHHAAQTSVPFSVASRTEDARQNIGGTLRTLAAAKARGAKLFVFASTGGALYGECAPGGADEETPPVPQSPYGVSKLAAEHYVRISGLPYVVLRYANVYGVGDERKEKLGVVRKFLNASITDAQVTINGSPAPVRDFVHVEDVVKVNVAAIEGNLAQGTYNIGTGIGTSVARLATLLGHSTDRIETGPAKPGEVKRSVLNVSRIRSAMRYEPLTLEEGLGRL